MCPCLELQEDNDPVCGEEVLAAAAGRGFGKELQEDDDPSCGEEALSLAAGPGMEAGMKQGRDSRQQGIRDYFGRWN